MCEISANTRNKEISLILETENYKFKIVGSQAVKLVQLFHVKKHEDTFLCSFDSLFDATCFVLEMSDPLKAIKTIIDLSKK